VRRALGASRLDVFVQHVVETELIGVVGGVLGIALSASLLLVLNGVVKLVANRSDLFRLDLPMLGLSVLLSLGAGLLAGVYPAWRVCRIAPATLLKG
ncbi:MAG TPA: FtsX-like permease family protein, partial [Thermoanaerobaculia bacterium]|nr:FtsX-like permease family protein [Thermoanaerobaculia bacterium]